MINDVFISDALSLISQERERQINQEGYSLAHDDEHNEGQLALLAAAYALSSRVKNERGKVILSRVVQVLKNPPGWPFKPEDPIRDLTRAGALILAELERRLRAEEKKKMSKSTVQLPKWQSHKIVAADKIVGAGVGDNKCWWNLACGARIENPPISRVPEGVNPTGGYFVEYEDGFESWSPAEAFERGYTRLPHDA